MIDAHLRAPLLLALLLPLAACQEPAPVAPTPPVAAVPTASATASAASSAVAPPTGAQATKADLVRLLCADGKEPCEIRRDRAAGQDGAGHKLRVVSVYRGVDDLGEAPEPSEPDAGPPPLGIEETDRVDTISPALGYSACQRFDYWLLSEGPQGAPKATRLGTMCNEGHGASGVGEDTLTIGDNKLGYTTVGGSNWRWGRTMELSLSPLRAHTTSFSGYWTMGQNNESRFFSWDEFSGSVNWYSPICLPDGSAPEEDPDAVNGERAIYAYASIPAVDFEGDFPGAGWKDTALDRCALHTNAAGKSAFTTFGKPGEASDASMKVVASKKGELFVEVEDDKWVGPSASWVKDDHLELWLAKELPGYFHHCLGKDLPKPQQWGIRIADGKVFAGAGKPDVKALAVEKVALPSGTVRLKITLPKGMAAITLVYSDSDDGKKQERLFATSMLVPGKVETLGALLEINPAIAVCRVEGGKLEPVLKAHTGEKAILDIE